MILLLLQTLPVYSSRHLTSLIGLSPNRLDKFSATQLHGSYLISISYNQIKAARKESSQQRGGGREGEVKYTEGLLKTSYFSFELNFVYYIISSVFFFSNEKKNFFLLIHGIQDLCFSLFSLKAIFT
jgi:hypothetical protein